MESITGWVIGEYGAGGGEEASVVMVAALVVMVAVVVVAAMVVVMEVAVVTVEVVVVVIMSVEVVCGILLSAVAVALLVDKAQEEFLLTMPTLVVGKNRRCSLPGLGPTYRPLSRPRCCWFRFLLL